MQIRMPIVAIVGVTALAAGRGSLRAQQASSRSVLDGVYTEAQAKRGEALYVEHCALCHGSTLTGADEAPALAGGPFTEMWKEATLGDLFERSRATMPASAPGSLSGPQNADLLAYMLKCNKFPAGTTDLGTETDLLKQIRIGPPGP